MIGYRRVAIVLYLCALNLNKRLPFDLCVSIALRAGPTKLYVGKSSYARRRRAKLIGRCHRCYRVSPGFYFTTRCDGVTCVPGISYKVWVKNFIKFGYFDKEE